MFLPPAMILPTVTSINLLTSRSKTTIHPRCQQDENYKCNTGLKLNSCKKSHSIHYLQYIQKTIQYVGMLQIINVLYTMTNYNHKGLKILS